MREVPITREDWVFILCAIVIIGFIVLRGCDKISEENLMLVIQLIVGAILGFISGAAYMLMRLKR